MPNDPQLDRIERVAREALEEARGARQELRTLNGKVASHHQTLHGVGSDEGVVGQVRDLYGRMNRVTPGMTSVKTVWTAVGAISAVAAAIVAFALGVG